MVLVNNLRVQHSLLHEPSGTFTTLQYTGVVMIDVMVGIMVLGTPWIGQAERVTALLRGTDVGHGQRN